MKRHIVREMRPGGMLLTMCGRVVISAATVPTYSHRLNCESCRRARKAQKARAALEEAMKDA